jgi:hypothetical protein
MTPKEKAEKLFNKFIIIDDLSDSTGNSLYFNAHAKQCAIVAVDEIIEATNMYQYGISNALEHIPSKIVKHPYWQEVKQEIENL